MGIDKFFVHSSETPDANVEKKEIALESGEKIIEKELCDAIRKVFNTPGTYGDYIKIISEDLTTHRNGYQG